ncbi:MAG: hypothetical protein ACI8PT_001333 [Gammaproteobacteria bacterium]|jgi:hypothetical protein
MGEVVIDWNIIRDAWCTGGALETEGTAKRRLNRCPS